MSGIKNESNPSTTVAVPDWLELVRQQVNSLRFGVVQIVVHDSRVVQVDKTERVRLGQESITD